MRSLTFFLAASAAVAQVGPDYQRPDTAVPPKFKGVTWRPASPSAHLPKGEWWKVFRDAKLNELMARAGVANQDLKAALARFEQARAAARVARGDYMPSLSLPLSVDRQRTSENQPSPIPLSGLRYDGPAYNALADFGWELDLWGKIRRYNEGARADAVAAADAVHNVLLGIQAEVASNYFQLRALDQEIRLVREAVSLRGEALAIAQARVRAGAGSELEQAQAEAEVASAEAEISTLQVRRDQYENALAILTGSNAAIFRIAPAGAPPSPPSLPAGLPSDLIERRPDIAQAERALVAATARIGVAKAQFFPSLRLIGRGGYQSMELDALLQPTSLMWSYGPSLSVPVFTGGKNRFNLEKARAVHDEALAGWRQAFLSAVADVENSLAAIRHLAVAAEAQQRARSSAERAAALAKTRYEAGTSPYLDVIDANRTALAMQRATAQTAGLRLAASVALVKALGGGWDDATPLPVVEPDPAAQMAPEGSAKRGVFGRLKGLFRRG
jgi:multidrug efflux system outer membrane protein